MTEIVRTSSCSSATRTRIWYGASRAPPGPFTGLAAGAVTANPRRRWAPPTGCRRRRRPVPRSRPARSAPNFRPARFVHPPPVRDFVHSTVPGCFRQSGARLRPGIGHAYRNETWFVAQAHGRAGRVGVPERVRERLLDDPVRGEIDPGSQGRACPAGQLHRRPGRAPGPARRPVRERRRRRGLQVVGWPAQHPEQPAQLGQGLAGGIRDHLHRPRGVVRPPGSSEEAASACTAIRLTWCATTS